MIERLITPEEASEILGVTAKSLANSRYTRTGIDIPYIRLGNRIRYQESDLIAYIEKNKTKNIKDKEVS